MTVRTLAIGRSNYNDLLTSRWDKQTQTINDESNLPPKRLASGKQAPPVEKSAKVRKSLLSRSTASEPNCAQDGRES